MLTQLQAVPGFDFSSLFSGWGLVSLIVVSYALEFGMVGGILALNRWYWKTRVEFMERRSNGWFRVAEQKTTNSSRAISLGKGKKARRYQLHREKALFFDGDRPFLFKDIKTGKDLDPDTFKQGIGETDIKALTPEEDANYFGGDTLGQLVRAVKGEASMHMNEILMGILIGASLGALLMAVAYPSLFPFAHQIANPVNATTTKGA